MIEDIINEREKTKINFVQKQSEKSIYLGEFKENILAGLNISDIEKGIVDERIKEYMRDEKAKILKIKRDIEFEKITPYIKEAEKLGLKYTLVDDISFIGDVGIVIVSKEPLDNENEEVILESPTKVFTDAGLSKGFAFAYGKKISSKYYNQLKEKLPEYIHKFEEMSFWDRLFGKMCPIEQYEKLQLRDKKI